jgi:hypothetical protein
MEAKLETGRAPIMHNKFMARAVELPIENVHSGHAGPSLLSL